LSADKNQTQGKVSRYVDVESADGMYWGDTDLHASLSTDAALKGNLLAPDQAHRIATGEQLTSSSGVNAKLSRPINFPVVADYLVGMDFVADMFADVVNIVADPKGKECFERICVGDAAAVGSEVINLFTQGEFPSAPAYTSETSAYRSSWVAIINSAEPYNESELFAAFIGY
jgi:hypothetical protein